MAGIANGITECGGKAPYMVGDPICMGMLSCPGATKPYGEGAMGIPGNAMGAAGYMPGMLCMGCIAPGRAKPGDRVGMGAPPGPIIAYGIPCIICSQQSTSATKCLYCGTQCTYGQMEMLQDAMHMIAKWLLWTMQQHDLKTDSCILL